MADEVRPATPLEAARAYNRAHRAGRQRRGPLTDRTLEVLTVLKESDGPVSYEGIAERVAEQFGSCARSSVALAVMALRRAGLLTWERRLRRSGWRLVRATNSYRIIETKLGRPNSR